MAWQSANGWHSPGLKSALGYSFTIPMLLMCLFSTPIFGQLERLEIVQKLPFQNGQSFGDVGTYELVLAKAHLAIDPKHPDNQLINDLDLAIPDEDGLVRYQSHLMICRPTDPGKANGSLIVDIPNRGRPVSLFFNFPELMFRGPEFRQKSPGDGFLMKQGFSMVSIGWQMDVPAASQPGSILGLDPPKTRKIEGLVRTDIVFSEPARNMPLGHWGHRPYPVSNPNDARNKLTVRNSDLGERRTIPRDNWRFGRWQDNDFVPDPATLSLKQGQFEKGKIYEVVYLANEPRVLGLGFAALRDTVTYLRHHAQSPIKFNRTLAYGASQTGRFLRHFLYLGMNRDRNGQRVLDGVFATVAGAGRGSFNHRFGQPSRANAPFEMFAYPTDTFPFTASVQKDALSGLEDGLFKRLRTNGAMPKLFLLNSGHEYWGRGASLLHTTPDGNADQALLPEVRIYHLTSVQHGPASLPLTKIYLEQPKQTIAGRYLLNPANYIWCERALLLALDQWLAKDKLPPPSRYPTIAEGQLVRHQDYHFPAIPHIKQPQKPYTAHFLDYGPRFRSHGIMSQLPPKSGAAYGNRIPQTNSDGNELGGLHLPEVTVPLGTHTSWNLRDPNTGAGDELMALSGAFLPFANNADQRQKSGDPRPSIAERYPSRDDYIGKFTHAAVALIREGYLLADDLPNMVDYAGVWWDYVHQLNEESHQTDR